MIGGLGGSSGTSGPGSDEGVVYQGFIEIDGGEFPAALEIIRAEGPSVRGALQTSSGLQAEGEGRIRGKTLTLDLTYGGDCPGRMALEGEWDEDTRTYEGIVEASDCTGSGRGGFRFSAS